MLRFSRVMVVVVAVVLAVPLAARAEADATVKASLVADVASIRSGEPFTVALRLAMPEGAHVYWRNPGESGLAPTLDWKLPDGFEAGPIQWPTPRRIESQGVVSYGYEGTVRLLVEITPPATLKAGQSAALEARADWLVCT